MRKREREEGIPSSLFCDIHMGLEELDEHTTTKQSWKKRRRIEAPILFSLLIADRTLGFTMSKTEGHVVLQKETESCASETLRSSKVKANVNTRYLFTPTMAKVSTAKSLPLPPFKKNELWRIRLIGKFATNNLHYFGITMPTMYVLFLFSFWQNNYILVIYK